jgi:Flp pilus assembly protein TadD
LIEAGEYREAREILEQAIAADPNNDTMARGNLAYLDSIVR